MRKWLSGLLALSLGGAGLWYVLYEVPPRQPSVQPAGTLIQWQGQESEYQGKTVRTPDGKVEQHTVPTKPKADPTSSSKQDRR